jgi:hypothetical protein
MGLIADLPRSKQRTKIQRSPSLDDFIGEQLHRIGDGKAERPGGLQILAVFSWMTSSNLFIRCTGNTTGNQ